MAQSSARHRRVHPVSLTVGIAWLAVDQITKSWAVARLSRDRMIHVIGSLRFNLSHNSGMAFGTGRGFGPVLGVLALLVVVYLLVGLRTESSRLSQIAVGMVMASHLPCAPRLSRLFFAPIMSATI